MIYCMILLEYIANRWKKKLRPAYFQLLSQKSCAGFWTLKLLKELRQTLRTFKNNIQGKML